ncbi:MAG: hypothetical protein WB441_10500 [Nocardioidaceae bacterium]
MTLTNARRSRRVAAGALIPFVAALVATTSSPAQASTRSNGCTVTPLTPVYAGYETSGGDKMIRYRISVACEANRSAVVNWQGVEEDWSTFYHYNPDDTDFSRTVTVSFGPASTRTLSYDDALPNTERGKEEMYHKIRFRVISNGVVSPRTAWERTRYVSFFN